jgi:hypothetical protein
MSARNTSIEMLAAAKYLLRNGPDHTSFADQLAALRLSAMAINTSPDVKCTRTFMDVALGLTNLLLSGQGYTREQLDMSSAVIKEVQDKAEYWR